MTNYFHVPQALLAEMRALLVELEGLATITDDQAIKDRATIAKTALAGVNAYASDSATCQPKERG